MTFFFVLLRVGAAVFTMPVIGAQSVSRTIRFGISFWLAVILVTPYLGLGQAPIADTIPPSVRVYHGVVEFSIACISEFLIGYSLGFMFQILIATIGFSGEIIGKEAGFSAASVFDPITGEDNFLLAQINVWIGTLIFLIIGGPEMVFRAVADSFHVVNPGEIIAIHRLGDASYRAFLFDDGRHYALMTILYSVGLRMALPMIGSMLLISLAEAFIARTAPQLNVMSVGFAVRMAIALFLLANIFVYVVMVFKPHLQLYLSYSKAFLGRLAPS